MAIYHCSVKTVSRSKGASACAGAAYRAGEKIVDLTSGKTHDYSRKSDVGLKLLIGWNGTRSELWNCAEQTDTRKNATTAREYEVAIPKELDLQNRQSVVRQFGQWIHDTHGVAVDICIHDQDGDTPHAHILTTTRETLGDSLGEKVSREWSDTRRKKAGLSGRKQDLLDAREKWAELANAHLAADNQIDHRSNEARGITSQPQVKKGKATHHQQKRTGKKNERYLRYEESLLSDTIIHDFKPAGDKSGFWVSNEFVMVFESEAKKEGVYKHQKSYSIDRLVSVVELKIHEKPLIKKLTDVFHRAKEITIKYFEDRSKSQARKPTAFAAPLPPKRSKHDEMLDQEMADLKRLREETEKKEIERKKKLEAAIEPVIEPIIEPEPEIEVEPVKDLTPTPPPVRKKRR